MSGEIEAQARLLVRQAFVVAPLARLDQLRLRVGVLGAVIAEERNLRRRPLGSLGLIERNTDGGEQACAPLVDRVECASPNQRLDRAPARDALVDAAAEIEKVGERTAAFACRDNRLDRRLSRALDAAETIADLLLVDRLEPVVTRVDVGRQHG